MNASIKIMVLACLAASIAGCTDRSAMFVPQCNASAPAHLEVETGSDRVDATLQDMQQRGWSNVTSLLERRVASADCETGTRQGVYVADEIQRGEATSNKAFTRGLLITLAFILPLGTGAYFGFRGWIIAQGLTFYALAFALGHLWAVVAFTILMISAGIWFWFRNVSTNEAMRDAEKTER